MKVNHEVPKCLLQYSFEFSDYDFCLPHLLDKDEEYRQYFLDAKSEGRYIIMDNSLHELKDINNGNGYDHNRLIYWVNELEPDEFIVPDVWMDFSQTCVQAKHWKQFTYPKNTTLVAVVQGKNESDAYKCYRILKDLGYKKIAFSYGASWYNDIFPHPNKDFGKALGRISFISRLYADGAIHDNDRVHLLGCSVPQEFGWYRGFSFIESIDTSNPIMAALEKKLILEGGLIEKPKANMNDFFDIKFEDIDHFLVELNVAVFREINGISEE